MGLRFICAAEEPRHIFIDKDWVGKQESTIYDGPLLILNTYSFEGIYINDRENIIVFYSIL